LFELGCGDRPGVVVALGVVAAEGLELGLLADAFDAFGDGA